MTRRVHRSSGRSSDGASEEDGQIERAAPDRRATTPAGGIPDATTAQNRPGPTIDSVSNRRKRIASVNPSGLTGEPAASPMDAPRRSLAPRRQTVPNRHDNAEADPHLGRTYSNKYRIEEFLAKGGMGRVYRAEQFPLARDVAIKILNREFQQSDPSFVRRFFLEAAITAKLSHPHIITVFDYGETDNGELFIAMEYLRGRPLSRAVSPKSGSFTAEQTIRVGMQVCRALREAHKNGIIHRDLKPGNVFLLEGETDALHIKVLDFGLVKLFTPDKASTSDKISPNEIEEMLDEESELTRTGTLLGSPKYMSPEQISGQPLDVRTDIYSLGIILYFLVTAKTPFRGRTSVDIIYKHLNEPVPRMAEDAPDIKCPEPLEALIRQCLEKDREQRHQTMDALLADLKDVYRKISGRTNIEGQTGIHSSVDQSIDTPNPLMFDNPLPPVPGSREAAFREEFGTEGTSYGSPIDDPSRSVSPPLPAPSRLPLGLAALGFIVALSTLAYVLVTMPRSDSAGRVSNIQTPIPALPDPPDIRNQPANAPPVEKPAPDPIPEPPTPAPALKDPVEKTKLPRSSPKKPRPSRRSAPPPSRKPAEDEPELPPNYRDNPY